MASPSGPSLSDDFKAGFRRHATGVAVVTARTPQGTVGLTASSVASVSADPPLLSFSVSRASTTGAAVVGSDDLTIHLLGADQVLAAAAFARPSAVRFAEPSEPADDGLGDSPATFRAHPTHVVPAGQSWLVLAEVTEARLGAPVGPLIYHDRGYWSLGDERADSATVVA